MAGNTFGKIFKLTTFGESHGTAVGGVIDGCPSGIVIDEEFIAKEIKLRSSGKSKTASARKEQDKVEFVSGIFEGKTTGTPIAFIIKNTDHHSSDYDDIKDVFRPSHADFTYFNKYGIRDYRGGGRASARESISRVVAGAIAKLILNKYSIDIFAYTSQIGEIQAVADLGNIIPSDFNNDILCCPDKNASVLMQNLLDKLKQEGDSTGCIITCVIKSCPVGLGEPVFDKLQADLAKAMLSIPAAKGFEYGEGFKSVSMKGSEHNDLFEIKKNKIVLASNHSGGIQGGISNGEDIYFKIAFKPISSIQKPQKMVDINGSITEISVLGRHDVCIAPRVISVVESMAALVVLDHLLINKTLK